MTPEALSNRSRQYALGIVKLASSLPDNRIGDVFARLLLRCSTTAAANDRAACRARPRAAFVARMGAVEQEADETLFWIEMAADAGPVRRDLVEPLPAEENEICSVVTASRRIAHARGSKQ